MDPDATLEQLRQAVRDGDAATARYLRKELRSWVYDRLGRPPKDSTWRSA